MALRDIKFRIPEKECIVYLENLQKMEEDIYDAYVDFRLQKDVKLFRQSINVDSDINEDNTYLFLQSIKSVKRLIRGCYYKLNIELVKQARIIQHEESAFVWRYYDFSGMELPSEDADELLQSHEMLDPDEMYQGFISQNFVLNQLPDNDLKLVVKGVGQANWNELRSGDSVQVVYDMGAPLNAKKSEVVDMFNACQSRLKEDKPTLVISHWDMDHIHCLKYMDVQTISDCFSKCVCVDKMKSVTSTNLFSRIEKALGKSNILITKPAKRTSGIDMHHFGQFGNLAFYVGEESRNINYSGVCMFFQSDNKSAAFTGDVRLLQAKKMYDAEVAKGINIGEHILIAPHHGGDYSATVRIYAAPISEVIISVGDGNGYGHPEEHMLNYLKSISKDNVKRTDEVGDVI